MNIKNSSRGFTLVELMIVVAIIALLSGIVMMNFGSTRGRARDAKRISDMSHLQLALELFFDRCNSYPDIVSGTTIIDEFYECPTNSSVTLRTYIAQVPAPPSSPTFDQADYMYQINTSKTDYILYTQLEYYNEVVKDGLPTDHIAGSPSFPCSNVVNSTHLCVGPR